MIQGLKTGAAWKIMLALIWYGVSFCGFAAGPYVGTAVLVVAWTLPFVTVSVYDAIVKGEKEKLYTIPVFVVAIGISAVLLGADYCQRTKTATADVAVAETDEAFLKSEQAPPAESSYSEKVYVTKSGSKYHKEDCKFIKDKQTVSISVSDAENSGKTPCSVCLK